MKKSRLVLFLIIFIAILAVPVIIFTANNEKKDPDYITIGDKTVKVSKGKTKEDYLLEKELATVEPINKKSTDSNVNENINDKVTEEKVSEKYVILEQKLMNLAEKYDKKEEYESIKKEIEKQETVGVVTENHEKLCDIFMDLYKNENLTEDEKQSVKDFLEIILFNELDKDLENRIRDLIY